MGPLLAGVFVVDLAGILADAFFGAFLVEAAAARPRPFLGTGSSSSSSSSSSFSSSSEASSN